MNAKKNVLFGWFVLLSLTLLVGCGIPDDLESHRTEDLEHRSLFPKRHQEATYVAPNKTPVSLKQLAKPVAYNMFPRASMKPTTTFPTRKKAELGEQAVQAYFAWGSLYIVRQAPQIEVELWNVHSRSKLSSRRSSTQQLSLHTTKQSPDRRWLAMQLETGHIQLWELGRITTKTIHRHGSNFKNTFHGPFAFSKTSGTLYYHEYGQKQLQYEVLSHEKQINIPSLMNTSNGDFAFLSGGRIANVYNTCFRTPSNFRVQNTSGTADVTTNLSENRHVNLSVHPKEEVLVAYNNGRVYKSLKDEKILNFLSPKTGKELWKLKTSHFTWSQDGRFLITASKDIVKYWDWKNKKVVHTIAFQGHPSSVQVSSDGSLLAVTIKETQTVQVWTR